MANPYHDENGMFCSKGEMLQAIQRTDDAGNFKAMFALKDSLAEIEKNAVVEAQVKEVVPAARPVRARKSFFADETTLDKRTIAKSLHASSGALTELSKSKDVITRIGVAANRSAPVEVITKLATDKDWGVRAGVAKNSSAPREVLDALAADENSWVQDAVKGNRAYAR